MKRDMAVSVSNPVFALDDVKCAGTETSLADCAHSNWFTHNCIDTELAAVTCVTVQYPTPERESSLNPPSPPSCLSSCDCNASHILLM